MPELKDSANRRALLLRTDEPTSDRTGSDQVRELSKGFDGLEWSDDSGDPPRGWEVGALASACSKLSAAEAAADLIALLRLANRFGAKVLNVELPGIEPSVAGRPAFRRYQDALNHAHGLFRLVRYEAASLGVAIGLEPVRGGCFLSPVELREMLDLLSAPAIGCCLDVARVARFGSPVDWLQTLRNRVHAVRIAGEADPIMVGQLRDAMNETNYSGPVILVGPKARSLRSLYFE